MPAVSAEGGVDFMLPPQSDHQSKGLLYSLFLGPEAFWASLMRTSSISILVRMGHIPCVVCIDA